jgi:hypothetical protein
MYSFFSGASASSPMYRVQDQLLARFFNVKVVVVAFLDDVLRQKLFLLGGQVSDA